MKRLVVVAAVSAIALAGCGASGSGSVRHVVALDQSVPATAEPELTIPPITVPPEPAGGAAGAVHAAPVDASRTQAQRASRSGRRSAGGTFDALAQCESGGNPQAVGGGGKDYGAFQFSLATWRSLGYSGNPTDHSYETQKAAAQKLVRRSGWSQFPSCSRR